MSPNTMDTIVPAIIFGSTVTGTFLFATAPDIQTGVMGICILCLAFMVCYYEFVRLSEITPPSKPTKDE